MKRLAKITLVFLISMSNSHVIFSQGLPMGEVLIISTSSVKKDAAGALQTYVREVGPAFRKANVAEVAALVGDRGGRKGEVLLVCSAPDVQTRKRLASGSPFTDKVFPASVKSRPSAFLLNPDRYTEYRLLGAGAVKPLPAAGILGIHFIKVRKDMAEQFEKFVVEKLHPKTAHLLPDLQLLYYKAVDGDNAGTYITIFSLRSNASRESYWPGGTSETDPLKNAFRPLKELALELSTYLEPDSFLKPESGGAAAYFESLEWTDFVLQ